MRVTNSEQGVAALVIPTGRELEDDMVRKLTPEGFRRTICRDYGELKRTVLPWLDPYMLPVWQAITTDSLEHLSRPEQIAFITPLFLRLFKRPRWTAIYLYRASCILPDDMDQKLVRTVVDQFYASLVGDQLRRLAAPGRPHPHAPLPRRNDRGSRRSRVHHARGALEIAQDCALPASQDPGLFMIGFRQEYLNAVAHAYTGVANPRGREWATYLRLAWLLSRNDRVVLDPQFLLTPDVARRTIRFEDLWDVVLGGRPDPSKELIVEFSEMMSHCGFDEQLGDTLQGGFIQLVDHGSTSESMARFIRVLEQIILKNVTFHRRPRRAGTSGGSWERPSGIC